MNIHLTFSTSKLKDCNYNHIIFNSYIFYPFLELHFTYYILHCRRDVLRADKASKPIKPDRPNCSVDARLLDRLRKHRWFDQNPMNNTSENK